MIKAGRERPSNLEAKRQLLIDAARHNLEEEVDDLENLTSKGIAFDDAIAQTLTRWEITDQDRAQVGEGLAKAYQLVRELRASNKAEVERRYLEHCRAAAANAHRRAVERDEAEFFSLPTAVADFSRWNRKKHWHLEEAVALSLGKNPKIVNLETLTQLRRQMSPFVSKFWARMEALQHAISAGHILMPLARGAFIDWAVNEGFLLPPELNATHRTDPSGEEAKDDEINPKTREVFYRFLIGMARKHYSFDPAYDPKQGDKSDVFAKMMRDLGSDYHVDVKTLRTQMDRALEHQRAKGRLREKVSGKPVAR
jgi:hypothetical protein